MRAGLRIVGLERLFELIGWNRVIASYVYLVNRRPFGHKNHQHIPFPFKPHILEKPGFVQRANSALGILFVDVVADFNWQIIKYGSDRNTLQTFQPDVVYTERLDSICMGCIQQGRNNGY